MKHANDGSTTTHNTGYTELLSSQARHSAAEITKLMAIFQKKRFREHQGQTHRAEQTIKHKEATTDGDILKLLQLWKR